MSRTRRILIGPTGHVLGPKRNAEMVALGADVCGDAP